MIFYLITLSNNLLEGIRFYDTSFRILNGKPPLFGIMVLLLTACGQNTDVTTLNRADVNKPATNKSAAYGRQDEFSYPSFSGEYAVGSRTIVIEDPIRFETLANDKDRLDNNQNRKVQIRFYYPTNSKSSEPDTINRLPVISLPAWDYLIGHQELNGKQLRYENFIGARWNISLNASLGEQLSSYPILIFSHGYGYNAESYSALSAELASKGFIVASINHTYGANPVDFGSDQIVWAIDLPLNSVGSFLPIWSADQVLLINHLNLMNSDSRDPFYQKLDLASIGILGHSYGGAAAVHTAAIDPRIAAVMNIDGTLFNFKDKFINQPFALLLSKDHQPKFDFRNLAQESYVVRLKQFEHASFSDHILWWQWEHDEIDLDFGDVDAHRAVELTTDLVNQFFSKYLRGNETVLYQTDSFNNREIRISRISDIN